MDNFIAPNSLEFDYNSPQSVSTVSNAEDFDFCPIARDRANTWPQQQQIQVGPSRANLTPTADFQVKFEPPGAPLISNPVGMVPADPNGQQMSPPTTDSGKKPQKSPHRNAWGDASYADLITQAIESTPDKRMTLAQIYDWIIQNVPYFRDKGVEFSAGWKNSIRHNLSLRTRFIRCQNETAGKSSWWMIDPDVKAKKSARPRAGSAGMVDQKLFRPKKYQNACKQLDLHCRNSNDSDSIDVVGLGESSGLQQGSSNTPQWPKHNSEINTEPAHITSHSSSVGSGSIYGKIGSGVDNFAHRHSIYPTDLRHFIGQQTSAVSTLSDNGGPAGSDLPPYAHSSAQPGPDYSQFANLDGWMFPDEVDGYPGLYDLGFNKLWQR